jgi:hypothetical protein
MANNDLTILVCSCDAYEDLWYPYFEIFKNHWPDCPYPLALNTESKSYSHDGLKIKTFEFYTEDEAKNVDWSTRMIKTLEAIDTEFVLVTLEDHFLASPVDTKKFEEAFEIIKNHKEITQLSFINRISKDVKTKRIGNFARIPINNYFRVNLDTAIWRRKRMLKTLRAGENAWEYELNATERALWDFHDYYGYQIEKEPILDVSFHLRKGYGLFRGKWVWRNPELFEKFNIPMDFLKRGYMNQEECIAYVENEVRENTEFDKKELHKDNKFKSFLVQAKRRIPVNFRIFLSKIKRSLPIKWKD